MAKKSLSMKVVVLLMAAVLLIGCSVGGTLAWLIANSATVTNTFVVGDINIQLTETDAVKDETDGIFKNNNFKVLPGTTQAKDPKVIVEAGSEACWLFVQVKEENNNVKDFNTKITSDLKYVTWNIADDWTQLGETKNGVSTYYIDQDSLVDENVPTATYSVIKGNEVSYSADLTKEDINALGTNHPQLTFKAFAVQKEAANDVDKTEAQNAAIAWDKVDTSAKLG